MNNKQVIYGICLSISRNTLLIYIRIKIGDTGDLYGIPGFSLHLGFMNLLIIILTNLLVNKDYVYSIRWSSILRLAIF